MDPLTVLAVVATSAELYDLSTNLIKNAKAIKDQGEIPGLGTIETIARDLIECSRQFDSCSLHPGKDSNSPTKNSLVNKPWRNRPSQQFV